MTRFFFDFRADQDFMRDEDGTELPHVAGAHEEALGALVDAICDIVAEGQSNQQFAVEVRDDLGPVLEITATFGSRILRRQ